LIIINLKLIKAAVKIISSLIKTNIDFTTMLVNTSVKKKILRGKMGINHYTSNAVCQLHVYLQHVDFMSGEQEIQIELESAGIDTIHAIRYEYLITRHVSDFKGELVFHLLEHGHKINFKSILQISNAFLQWG
jgi:hypothetical protein